MQSITVCVDDAVHGSLLFVAAQFDNADYV
jgi:hypothetical protein